MDPIQTIGQKLAGGEQRDAIHIAILPGYIAYDHPNPGDEVALAFGTKNQFIRAQRGYGFKPIGIIDPFVMAWGYTPEGQSIRLERGDRVWCFLFPNSVQGMRHEWYCPAVDDNRPPTNEHETWLHQFAEKWHFDYQDMIRVAMRPDDIDPEYGIQSDYIVALGRDLHHVDELGADHDLFWQHLEALTKRTYNPEHRAKVGWSCTC